jgi:hypothetical protein
MAMTPGSVDRTTINATTGAAGTATGLAALLYAAKVAAKAALSPPVPLPSPTLGQTTFPFTPARPANAGDIADGNAARLKVFQDWADDANVYAQVVQYVIDNGEVVVSVQRLGRIPAGLTAGGLDVVPAGTAIDFPATPVHLPIT